MSIDPAQIAELRALMAKATPGEWHVVGPPWRPRDCGTYIIAGHIDPHAGTPVVGSIEIDEWPTVNGGPDYSQSDADLALVAFLHNLAPALLATIDAITAERDEARRFGEDAAKKYNDLLKSHEVRCAFCDTVYEDGTPATQHERLSAHIAVCEKHPMRAIEAERDRYRVALELLATRLEIDARASIAEASRIRSAVKTNTDAEERCVLRANLWRDCAMHIRNAVNEPTPPAEGGRA